MNYLKQFVIQFSGLSQGVHQYHFEIDDAFFAEREYSDIRRAKVNVNLQLEKSAGMMVLNFLLSGWVQCECDRCLEYYRQPVDGHNRIIVKFGEKAYEESEEVIVLPAQEHQIDLAHYLYEFIALCIPVRRVHPGGEGNECSPEVIARLEKLTQNQANDPRWDSLKNIIKNN